MKKKSVYLSITFLTFVLLFFLVISWKQPDLVESPPCSNIQNRTKQITILFPAEPRAYRKPGYEYYIPESDIVWNSTPALSSMDATKWFCIVTVTSPQCNGYSWEQAASPQNLDGNKMTIQIPPNGYSFTVNVYYKEQSDSGSTPDFNQDLLPLYNYSRGTYRYNRTFQSAWGNVSQPIYLDPHGLLGVDWNLQGIDAGGWDKSLGLRDGGINFAINNNKYNK